MNKLYTVKQVAEILQRHPNRVYDFLKSGKLRGIKLGANGKDQSRLHWRVTEADLNEFISEGSRRTHAERSNKKLSGTGRSTASHKETE